MNFKQHLNIDFCQQVKTRSTISLDSFQEKSDISKLSAKELKALLDDNFVDYKGCVEKEELVDRVVMLWESTKLQQQQLGQLCLIHNFTQT